MHLGLKDDEKSLFYSLRAELLLSIRRATVAKIPQRRKKGKSYYRASKKNYGFLVTAAASPSQPVTDFIFFK